MSDRKESAKQEQQRAGMTIMPAVDVVEDRTGITLTADLPGVPKDRLTARVDGETLLIEGDIALETAEGMEAVHAEMQGMRFRRVFTLSRELDTSKSEAAFRNGVLRLRIPKAEHAQPRKIEVKVG
ncbi:MAG: Hsp20/alpha crystallin family protein [Burkholderiales bacterium]|nr:Hsp20/alpha crystallin family protein [Burkholderiales bacterium]